MEQFSSLSLSDGPASIEYTQPSIKIHSFSTEVGETRVQFQVLKMNNSIFLWIGSRTDPTFDDLSVAMNTKYDNLPVSSRLFGNTSDLTSSNLSMRLVKRLGKPVYVSLNVPADRLFLNAIELRLQQETKAHPEKFGC
uniref:Proteasome assembly chaperone 4 n=2 Tax=Timema TaxID=61471 RepID=A0A7R9ARN4_TIMSH|nr:unnamed protein product [Timema shepardi]CAD7570689.1 unnamed protein product [Timema californicum]